MTVEEESGERVQDQIVGASRAEIRSSGFLL